MSNFKQYNSIWAGLGYPFKPWFIRNCGCGEVSIANLITETEKYQAETPKTIQPYCKQFAAPNGDGTYFAGIPKMMTHYGMTEVQEHQTMKPLWVELKKGGRVAIFLMGSNPGGSLGVHWTSGGHFVCATAYKVKDGKHYVYVKDSYSTSTLRNGWISYEDNMRGAIHKVWSGKLPTLVVKKTSYRPSTPFTGKLPSGTVRKGDSGNNVKRLKLFLNWCVGTKFTGKGKCGDGTIKAIKIWEKTYGITPDGIWGPACKKKAEAIIEKYAPKKSKYYGEVTKIAQACCNEKGGLEGGAAGDSTKGEVRISKWSDAYGWKYVIRLNDKSKRELLAQLAIDTCKNDHIGYDTKKPDRYTAWDLAEQNGHNIKGIKKNCETTCTELVSMCLRGVGVPEKYAKRHFDVAAATKMLARGKCPYVTVYTDKGHTQTTKYLLPGDILLSSNHAAIVVESPNAK